MRVGPERIAQQLEGRLQQLLPGEDEKRPLGRGGAEIRRQSFDEAGTLPLHRRHEGQHLHAEDRARTIDIGGTATTEQFGRAVIERLRSRQ